MISASIQKKKRRRRVGWAFVAVVFLGSVVAAQEAPEASVDPVAKLVQEYEAAVVKYVDTPHQEAEASLTKGYVAALDRIKGQAQTAGDLEAVLALRGEVERCQKNGSLSESDEGVHSALQGPRKALRAKLETLEHRRVGQRDAVTKSYESRMARLEGVLTKSRRIDDALRVRAIRNEMTASLSASPASVPEEPEGPPKTPEISLEIPRPDAEGWITLLDHNRLYGCDPTLSQIEGGRARFVDGVLRLEETSVLFALEAKNFIIRAEVKKVSGQNLSILCRSSKKGMYTAWYNGGTSFGIGRSKDEWQNIKSGHPRKAAVGFQEYEIHIDGDEIELWVNGEQIVTVEDDQVRKSGAMGLSAFKGVSEFRRFQVKRLD